jgi:UDPglucose 6-dehydrogenase
MHEASKALGERAGLAYGESAKATLAGADALIILTEWKEFRSPDFDGIAAALRHPVIFDGRNLYEPARMAERGFEYYGVGRGSRPIVR